MYVLLQPLSKKNLSGTSPQQCSASDRSNWLGRWVRWVLSPKWDSATNHSLMWVKQGFVNVPIEHYPTIGDIISNEYYIQRIFEGDVQNPQKGTFTKPCKTMVALACLTIQHVGIWGWDRNLPKPSKTEDWTKGNIQSYLGLGFSIVMGVPQ